MSPAQEFVQHEEDETSQDHIEENGQSATEFLKGFQKEIDETKIQKLLRRIAKA